MLYISTFKVSIKIGSFVMPFISGIQSNLFSHGMETLCAQRMEREYGEIIVGGKTVGI
ncbi:hypothetical protein EA14781_097_00010 [Escherichia albertii NBRC 107761 = DSM 17582]|nr:hypothetical protein EA14781_097_00010 [Escherichia albertii NBRC 107761 = DSM 17582]